MRAAPARMVCALMLAALLGPRLARAEQRPIQVEASASFGFTRASSSTFGGDARTAVQNGGPSLTAHVAVRFRHPVMPFLEVGATPIFRSDDAVDLGARGGATTAYNHLSASWVIAGPEVPIGPVRAWAGLGAYRLAVRSTVLGTTATSSDVSLGYGFGARLDLLSRASLRVGVGARLLLLSEAEIVAYQGALFIGWVWPR